MTVPPGRRLQSGSALGLRQDANARLDDARDATPGEPANLPALTDRTEDGAARLKLGALGPLRHRFTGSRHIGAGHYHFNSFGLRALRVAQPDDQAASLVGTDSADAIAAALPIEADELGAPQGASPTQGEGAASRPSAISTGVKVWRRACRSVPISGFASRLLCP